MASGNVRGTAGLGPGTVLDGKYEILSLLGAGGMGEVFKARHVHLNVYRCIKVMKQGLLTDGGYRARFLREAQLATQVHHPNIAAVHDFFLGDRGSYMVSEFIDGTTVRQWSAANGRFPLALAADVAVQVLAGLEHIHKRGLLHRDISSDNVMLSYDADGCLVAKIIDLGIAKDVRSVDVNTTQVGMLIGNPKYMSPEQLGGLSEGEQLDGRTDLYCLGVVLYEMLLGVPPFVSETPQGYIAKHLMQEPPPFATAKPDVAWADGLEAVIFRALEKDRQRRFADAREFSRALRRFLTAEAGTLTKDDVARLSRTADATVAQELPRGADLPTEITPAAPVDERAAERAFQRAWEDGNPAAWQAFLDAHRSSALAAKAQELLTEATSFEAASRSASDTGLREFLKRWPDGRHHLEAEIRLVALKQRLAENAYAQAVAADTYVAFRDFLARFPNAAQSEAARQALAERLAFETAAAAESEDAWDDYLETWASDPHAPAARSQREEIAVREEAAYEAAAAAKSAQAWEAFLERYSDGRRSARAERNRREALAFEQARQGGREALDDFLRSHPDGLLAKDARRLVRQLADTSDFTHARSLDTPAAWHLYLTSHPAGAHAADARARLTALEDAAFAAVTVSKSSAAGRAFLNDFPSSPRRTQVQRLVEKQAEGKAVAAALDAIARGAAGEAESFLAQVMDEERRNEVSTALENLREKQSWDAALGEGSAAGLRTYLQARPEGRWAAEARRRLARVEEQSNEHEPRDWDAAWESGTVPAWDRYLGAHSASPRITLARECRQEAVDFDLAVAQNVPKMWRAFLRAWPDGRHHLEAEIRLRSTAT
jgi:serine/threonine protein kinase